MHLAHPYIWGSIGTYALSYGASVLMLKYEIHGKGCRICNRYGDLCDCGHLKKLWDYLESFRAWMDNEIYQDSLTSRAVLIGFVITLPMLVGAIIVLTHAVNPLHRRSCLADILNGEAEEDD